MDEKGYKSQNLYREIDKKGYKMKKQKWTKKVTNQQNGTRHDLNLKVYVEALAKDTRA